MTRSSNAEAKRVTIPKSLEVCANCRRWHKAKAYDCTFCGPFGSCVKFANKKAGINHAVKAV